jgi:hypothetical protein
MVEKKIPTEMMELARQNNIADITVYKRVASGRYTIEEAVTRPVEGSKNCFKADNSKYYKRKKSKGIMSYYYDDGANRLGQS